MEKLRHFLITIFTFTWIFCLLTSLLTHATTLKQADLLPANLFYIGGFGPVVGFWTVEKPCLAILTQKLFSLKNGGATYLISFLLLELAFIAVSSRQLNPSLPLSLIPLSLFCALICDGGQEEIGWRGSLQPLMQQKYSTVLATFLSGCIWAVYHIPLWFIEGNSHQETSFLAFAMLAIVVYFWNTGIYSRTKSIFASMVFHASNNILMSALVIKLNQLFLLGIIVLLAIVIKMIRTEKL